MIKIDFFYKIQEFCYINILNNSLITQTNEQNTKCNNKKGLQQSSHHRWQRPVDLLERVWDENV